MAGRISSDVSILCGLS